MVYINNKDNRKVYKKEWYQKNKERISNDRKEQYKNDKEKKLKQSKIWRDNNKDKIKIRNKNYYNKEAKYNTYTPQINWCEETRRDSNDIELLQVRCTELNCRKWFNPTNGQARSRINVLNTRMNGESRFYCSDECKYGCSIFGKQIYPIGHKYNHNKQYREIQYELKLIVLERDNYECQRCGAKDKLRCHHFEGIEQNPIESTDIDMCITLCKSCHKLAHKDKGCRYIDLRKKDCIVKGEL